MVILKIISQMSNLKSQNYNSNFKSNNVKIRAYQLSLSIIRFVNELPNKRAFWIIGNQLLKATTSIGANMIEAQASTSKREFIKFYEISLKSANETQYWLSLLKDSFSEIDSKCELLLQETIEISKMIGSSILTLKGKRNY